VHKNKKKNIRILLSLCSLFIGVSGIHCGYPKNTQNDRTFIAETETTASAATAAVEVTSHKKFIKAVYKMALKREISGTFHYAGDSNNIFNGDLDQLLTEVCAIDKKTSDDADYLANSISTINVKTSYQSYGNRVTDSTITVQVRYLETMAQLQAVNQKVSEVLDELGVDGKSNYKKVKLIHDYIVNNTRYQTGSNCYTAYGALLEGRAVCQGYAQLAYKMLTEAGVKCYFISGKAYNGTQTQDHAWNLVKVGKKWYYLDCTWDDPTGGEDTLRYDYFLIGSNQFDLDHVASAEYSKKTAKASAANYKK
jgi:transglutaminase/protease-like cytokinesis protein 3